MVPPDTRNHTAGLDDPAQPADVRPNCQRAAEPDFRLHSCHGAGGQHEVARFDAGQRDRGEVWAGGFRRKG